MGKYDDMSADKLQDLAKKRGLPTSGTKPELAARLEAADAEKATAEKARRHPMLADDRSIDVDEALAFAGRVRDLAEELTERLQAEVVDPLTGMENTIDDPHSGVVLASSRRLLGAVDDVKRELQWMQAAAGTLAQDTVA